MICDIIKTFLFVLILRQGVSSQLMIKGIPNMANHGDVYRLRCSDTTVRRFWRLWGLWGKAKFNRNFNYKVTVDAGIFRCTVDNDNDVYGCESSLTSITLIINNINITRDNNTHWSCRGIDEKRSNNYTIFVKTVPLSCNLTTIITHTMKNTGDNKEDGADEEDNGDGSGDAGHDNDDVSNKLVLIEGDDLNLNCSTISRNQTTNISYKWKMFGDNTQTIEIHNQSIYSKPNITRRDAGMYVCTGSSGPDCDKNGVVYIRVQYPLSLNITVNYTSESIELICQVVDGYPTNFTMNNWTHYIDGQFVRELEGVVTEDRAALVLNNTILNEGTYVCNASNGIKDFKGTVHQTDKTYINIEGPPMILDVSNASEAQPGSGVEINTTFIIGGDVLNITWYQQQQNSSTITEILVDTTSEHAIRPVNIYGTVITKHVTIISGRVTISEMVDLNVTVTVCNEYGCTDFYQHITVSPKIALPTGTPDPGKVSGNSLVSSNEELPVNVPMIAGGVVGAVVLIGLIVLIIVLVRRRSNNKNKSAGTARQNQPDSFRYRNPTYDTSPGQPTNDQFLYGNDNLVKNQQQIRDNQTMEILENELYISADDDPTPDKVDHRDNNQMEIMENDLYISAEDETNPSRTGLQDGEMEILENDLYIPAEIDTRIF
ncbi:uncharacterized protein LOC126829842 isoform X2 [Patella vulgata]|uniref:uncharacterized protein LOC126829842 isoform X2 n=1 Tax=Patella vulgata TaxID=6465 RepID=UPI0024A7DF24|nr:uncharacterized protein LOC126829842 isoform X2 [Patella vulgata]